MSNAAQSSLARRGAVWSLLLLAVFLAAGEWGPGFLKMQPALDSRGWEVRRFCCDCSSRASISSTLPGKP